MGFDRYTYRQARLARSFLSLLSRVIDDSIVVNSRLEDLYSLLHFIQLEPWGKMRAASLASS